MPSADLVRSLAAGAALPLVLAACSDLFHSTDWPNACAESGASDCAPASPHATGSGGAAGAGGEGADDATGDFTSASASAGTGPTGSGGSGGAGGGGGASSGGAGGGGGIASCSTCEEVGQVVLDGSSSPPPSTLCPGAAEDAWSEAYACLCEQKCPGKCSGNACQLEEASNDCKLCAYNNCLNALEQCQAN